MSVINTQPLVGASGNQVTGYNLTKSLRFRSSAPAYLNRTPASASNRTTWTWSGWVKRGSLGSIQSVFGAGAYSNGIFLYFTPGDLLYYEFYDGASVNPRIQSVASYRDPAAWYHIVINWDSTNATANDRMRLYVNGVRQSVGINVTPTQNLTGLVNSTSGHFMGQLNGQYPFDGYMTEVNFIDGQALTPASFGEFDTVTGVWKPKRYTGSYGTNGFYLNFSDNSAATAAAIGKDSSGSGNNWTPNNISVTAGATYDSMTDVPTLTSAAAANYAVLNPLAANGNTISSGNLQYYKSGSSTNYLSASTIGVSSGKLYCEMSVSSLNGGGGLVFGITSNPNSTTNFYSVYAGATEYVYASNNGGKANNSGSTTAYGATYTAGDTIGIALDMDAGTLAFYKNGTSQGTAFSGLVGTYFPMIGFLSSAGADGTVNVNFGQRPFAYTPPSGFKALNTFNLPDSAIPAGNKVMDATTFTSTGTTQSVTNAAGFKPDLLWTKPRNQAASHYLGDSVRGVNYVLSTDSTGAENNYGTFYTSLNSNGFSLGTAQYSSGASVVAWQWQAGQGTTSTNTSGSITSTVSVNASAGFSIVTYQGNGTAGATVGHGLGVAPSFIIPKVRSRSGDSWHSYHSALGGTKGIILNSTAAASTDSGFWNNTNPSSSVITLGTYNTFSGQDYVAYCWAEVAGFSKFGSYTGNGSTDGPFVYTGFRPKFIMIKNISTAGTSWVMYDTPRNPENDGAQSNLWANNSNAENANDYGFDILSNGFKARATTTNFNESGATNIYMAFAENPFKNSLAR